MAVQILLRKTSLVDFPGRVASVFFFSGCNLRCPWCHNRELVSGKAEGLVSFDTALAHISKRRSVLGGVVLSGGEPCFSDELPGLVEEIRKLSLPVKLDTNGMFPAMLERLFGRKETCPDYAALDLKIAPERYAELIPGNRLSPAKPGGEIASNAAALNLIQSAAIIRASGIAHEYRTVALPGGFIGEKDIEALAPLADNAPWYFRPFRGGNCLAPEWNDMEENSSAAALRAETLAGKARSLGKNGISV